MVNNQVFMYCWKLLLAVHCDFKVISLLLYMQLGGDKAHLTEVALLLLNDWNRMHCTT